MAVFSSCARPNGNTDDEIYPGWLRHNVTENSLPFSIQLPEAYVFEIGRTSTANTEVGSIFPPSTLEWHTIRHNGNRVGGIFIGSHGWDSMLSYIEEDEILLVPVMIFDTAHHIRLFENTDRRRIMQPGPPGGHYFTDRFLFEANIEESSELFGKVIVTISRRTDDEEVKNTLFNFTLPMMVYGFLMAQTLYLMNI